MYKKISGEGVVPPHPTTPHPLGALILTPSAWQLAPLPVNSGDATGAACRVEWEILTIYGRFSLLVLHFNAESPPYFCLWFVWPTDLPHASTTAMIIFTKFEVDMTIHCQVIAFLLPIRCGLLTLNSFHTWWVTWSTIPPSLKILRLLFLSYES